MKELNRPRVWNFTRSRDFIRAYDLWARKYIRGYTRRSFAKWANISSPNFLTLVIADKRSLSEAWLGGFVRAAKLSHSESKYIESLVRLEHTTDDGERELLLQKMHDVLAIEPTVNLVGDLLELVRSPVTWTLYHMLSLADQESSAFWFRSRLIKKLGVKEIRDALELIARLGLAEIQDNGRLVPKSTKIESSDQFESAQNRIFHRFVLDEAKANLEAVAPEDRSYGSLTVAVSHSQEEEFKKEISRFGRRLLEKYGSMQPIDGNLFRVNLQLYPLTQSEKKS